MSDVQRSSVWRTNVEKFTASEAARRSGVSYLQVVAQTSLNCLPTWPGSSTFGQTFPNTTGAPLLRWPQPPPGGDLPTLQCPRPCRVSGRDPPVQGAGLRPVQ